MSGPSDTPHSGSWTHFFFLKTTFARLLLVVMLIGGLMAASTMVRETNPDLDIAGASIVTVWGSADAQTIEQEVTVKLEKELKDVRGLLRMQSGSY